MTKKVDELNDLMERLNELTDSGAVVVLTPTEVATLREIIKTWDNVKGFTAVSGVLGSTFKWIFSVTVIWIAFKAGLLEWIKSNVD